MYPKGGVIKFIKALAILKLELTVWGEEKIEHVRMWNRVKYFTTNCHNNSMSVFKSATQFAISL